MLVSGSAYYDIHFRVSHKQYNCGPLTSISAVAHANTYKDLKISAKDRHNQSQVQIDVTASSM